MRLRFERMLEREELFSLLVGERASGERVVALWRRWLEHNLKCEKYFCRLRSKKAARATNLRKFNRLFVFCRMLLNDAAAGVVPNAIAVVCAHTRRRRRRQKMLTVRRPLEVPATLNSWPTLKKETRCGKAFAHLFDCRHRTSSVSTFDSTSTILRAQTARSQPRCS